MIRARLDPQGSGADHVAGAVIARNGSSPPASRRSRRSAARSLASGPADEADQRLHRRLEVGALPQSTRSKFSNSSGSKSRPADLAAARVAIPQSALPERMAGGEVRSGEAGRIRAASGRAALMPTRFSSTSNSICAPAPGLPHGHRRARLQNVVTLCRLLRIAGLQQQSLLALRKSRPAPRRENRRSPCIATTLASASPSSR